MTATDVLFRPFRIAGMELANRIVMAPMTRSFAVDGIPAAAQAAYYRRRAEGGVGLILSEGTVIGRPASRNDPGVPFFHGDAALNGWKGVIDAVHEGGAKMGPQLWHTGALKSFLTEWVPDAPVESPSGLEAPGIERGVAMSQPAHRPLRRCHARRALALCRRSRCGGPGQRRPRLPHHPASESMESTGLRRAARGDARSHGRLAGAYGRGRR